MISVPKGSGSIARGSAVEPTRSQNRTVTWRRSASLETPESSPPRRMWNFRRGQSGADACKGACISRKRREAPNGDFLPGTGETPFHQSGDGSHGAPYGGRRGSGAPVHRRASYQQGAWRPAGAWVLRLRPTSRPVRGQSQRSRREDVSRHRAERRLRLLERFGRQPKPCVLWSFSGRRRCTKPAAGRYSSG
jgi:hypothetical protein